MAPAKPPFIQPLWLGDVELAGKTILLQAEQGLGDSLQFCRYVPMVVAKGAKVILEVQQPLKSLMSTLDESVTVIVRGEALPGFDLHCPLLSLPLAFGTRLESIPAPIPYLFADAQKVAAWGEKLGTATKPRLRLRIGLAWAGNPFKNRPNANHIDDHLRSLRFEQIVPLLEIEGIEYHSLQLGEDAVAQLRAHPMRERVIDHSESLTDFADTAALMAHLDLVIAVDTSVVHLAGALGKPFWLLNRYNTCWRWLLEREDNPWYPTARIFRQPTFGDWDSVIARVAAELRVWGN